MQNGAEWIKYLASDTQVLDTPDKKRVDLIEQIPYKYSIKIDMSKIENFP